MKAARRLGLTGTVILYSVLMGLIGLFVVDGPHFVSAQSQRSDATLSVLTMRDTDFDTFAPATTSYAASVYWRVLETTVHHSGASYVIDVEEAAEDGNTTCRGKSDLAWPGPAPASPPTGRRDEALTC